MFLNSIEFFITEAWNGFRRSGIMSIVSIGTVTISLTIFGAFLIAVVNIGGIVSAVSTRMEIIGYVNRDLEPFEANSIELKLNRIDGVEKVEFITKEKAWEDFRKDIESKVTVSDVLKKNPLPNTYILQVRTPELVPKVVQSLQGTGLVDDIRYNGTLIERLSIFANVVRFGGLVLVLLLAFATLMIVVNTIRLTVLSRETEIYIMKLVGATDSFVKWPFIIEGVLIGVIGSFFSLLILIFSYTTVSVQLAEALPFLPIVTDIGKLSTIYLIVGFVGTLLGMVGGHISVSKALKE